jgi:hypothetical protein
MWATWHFSIISQFINFTQALIIVGLYTRTFLSNSSKWSIIILSIYIFTLKYKNAYSFINNLKEDISTYDIQDAFIYFTNKRKSIEKLFHFHKIISSVLRSLDLICIKHLLSKYKFNSSLNCDKQLEI